MAGMDNQEFIDAVVNDSQPLHGTVEHKTRTCHVITFNRPATEDDVWEFARLHNFFGFHPAGYGGWVRKSDASGTIWSYQHSNSCD